MIVEPIVDPLDAPKYLLSELAQAANVTLNTARSWFIRKHLSMGENDLASDANGLPRLMTARTGLLLAIMGRCVQSGLAPALAAGAARKFTEFGHGNTPFEPTSRLPGRLYESGETVLVIPAGSKAGVIPRVVNFHEGDDWRKIYKSVGADESTPITLIRLSELVQSVQHRLGVRALVE